MTQLKLPLHFTTSARAHLCPTLWGVRIPAPVLLGVTILGWASAFVAIRIALPMGALPLATSRLLVASLVLGIASLARRPGLPARRDVPLVALMGLLGYTLYSVLLNYGEKTVPSGPAAFIIQTAPLWTTLLAVAFLRERVTPRGWLGIAVAMGGTGLLALGAPPHNAGDFRLGMLMIFGASLTTSVYVVLQKHLIPRYGAWATTVWSQWAALLWLLPTLPGSLKALAHADHLVQLMVLYLGLVPSAVCYVLWGVTLERFSASRATSFLYLLPFAATLLGWLLLREQPASMTLYGGLCTILGVALVNTGHKAERATNDEENREVGSKPPLGDGEARGNPTEAARLEEVY